MDFQRRLFPAVFLIILFASPICSQATAIQPITNESIIEFVQAGLSEAIIAAKIRQSKTSFDTSTNALVKLKENGVAESIILAMIEAEAVQLRSASETKTNNCPAVVSMKDLVGKRKIFLEAADEEGRLELIKRISQKKFSFVNDRNQAELVMELTFVGVESTQKAGIFRGGNETQVQAKIGKLVVRLKKETAECLAFAVEYDFARNASMAQAFGVSIAPPSLRLQVKYSLASKFIDKMKDAGDKF